MNKTWKLYKCFNEYGVEHLYIELLEKHIKCTNTADLSAREGQRIREIKPSLNTRVEGRPDKDYHKDNLDNKNTGIVQHRKTIATRKRAKSKQNKTTW